MELAKAVEGFNLYTRAVYAERTSELFAQQMVIIQRVLGNVEVEGITQTDLNRLMGYLKTEYIPFRIHQTGEKLSDPSLANYWKTLRAFFKWANLDMGVKRPDTNLVRPKFRLKEVKAFSESELKRLLYSAEWTKEISREGAKVYRRHRTTYARDLALIKFLTDTGLRLGELLRVQYQDVDKDGQITVRPFGNGIKTKPRFVYLGKSTQRVLWIYLAKRGDLRPTDKVFDLKPVTVRNILRVIAKNAGVTNCHPHRFRHTFAIEFLRNEKNPYSLQRILGHSSMEMTRHYLEIVEADIKREQTNSSPIDNWKL